MIEPIDVARHHDFARVDVTQWWAVLTACPPLPGQIAMLEKGGGATVMERDELLAWLRDNDLEPLVRRVKRAKVPAGEFLALLIGEPVRLTTIPFPEDETHPRSSAALGTLGLLGVDG